MTATDHFSLNQTRRSEAKLFRAALADPSIPARMRGPRRGEDGDIPRTVRRAERARKRKKKRSTA
jgi:hypothetical protein